MTKYGAKKTVIDNYTFASKREGMRYLELKVLLQAEEIADLELQPKYDIIINGVKVCSYVADFRYRERGELVVEDVKSEATRKNRLYRLKNKLMRAVHGIEIKEVA